MKDKLVWLGLLLVDCVVLALWMNQKPFYTWHFPATTGLGILLGATFSDVWLD